MGAAIACLEWASRSSKWSPEGTRENDDITQQWQHARIDAGEIGGELTSRARQNNNTVGVAVTKGQTAVLSVARPSSQTTIQTHAR